MIPLRKYTLAEAQQLLAGRVAIGGCKSCGSLNRPQALGMCSVCRVNAPDPKEGISVIAAGWCPVCCSLPHRRDAGFCTWCGLEHAALPEVETDAWSGYAQLSEWIAEGDTASMAVAESRISHFLTCKQCGALRKFATRETWLHAKKGAGLCRRCAQPSATSTGVPCPACGEVRQFRSRKSARTAERNGSVCRKCWRESVEKERHGNPI